MKKFRNFKIRMSAILNIKLHLTEFLGNIDVCWVKIKLMIELMIITYTLLCPFLLLFLF